MFLLVDNTDLIYQFTIILIFATALVFFVAMYWYSISLKKTIVEREQTKQSLKINTLELEHSQMQNEILEAEKIARAERNLRLQQEIDLKNKELVSSTLLLNEKRKVMSEIGELVSNLDLPDSAPRGQIRMLKRKLKTHTSTEHQWDNFRVHFEKVYPQFFSILKNEHPSLTQNDIRHCAYMRMQLSTKEIAQLLGINPTSVQISRVRLKKKLNLPSDVDLRAYILTM